MPPYSASQDTSGKSKLSQAFRITTVAVSGTPACAKTLYRLVLSRLESKPTLKQAVGKDIKLPPRSLLELGNPRPYRMDFDKLKLDDEVPAPKLPDLSRVMTLPTELRALIFEQVVSHDHLLTYKLDPFMKETYTEAVQPALTRVSRQIRAESLPLYYESNDFVLHTEGSRSDDARRWLRCNAQYLPKVRCMSFWLRYVTAANIRSTSQGAFSLSLRRPRSTVAWTIDDFSKWITVVRKPADLEKDIEYLTLTLGNMLEDITRSEAGPNDYYALMTDLRMAYLNQKTTKS